MPYPMSPEVIASLQSYKHQHVEIDIYPTEGDSISIDESRICEGGLVLNRKSASGSAIGFGECIASELSLILHNEDGFFDNVKFEGALLDVYLEVPVGSSYNPVQLGYFTVDGCPKKRSQIQLSALDDMVALDKIIPFGLFDAFPMTASNTIAWIVSHSELSQYNVTNIVNGGYMINVVDEMYEGITYRQLLAWVCQIVGANAFVDPNGVLQIGWYEQYTPVTGLSPLTPAMRSDFEYEDYDITLTGVKYVDFEGTEYAVNYAEEGQNTYDIVIDDNPLITNDPLTVVKNLGSVIYGFTYRPFSATIVPSPQLYPMDMIKLSIGNNTNIMTVITSITFQMNADTTVESVGESATSAGYAALNPLTGREAAVVAKLKQETDESLTSEIRRTLAFSELISNALGLYYTVDEQQDGSVIYYLHNNVTLDTSNVIFTINAGGVAWTNDWNNGSPVWTQGVSSSGDAFFKHISARGLDLSNVNDPYHIEITPSTFIIYYGTGQNETVVAAIKANDANGVQATTMQIPRILVSDYQTIGAVRLVGKSDGLDFVYVGN